VIAFSAKTGDGADILEQTITEMFFSGSIMDNNEVFLTNARHISAMSHAKGSLLHVIDSIENNMPEDFLTIDLMDAYEQLGYIIGESVEDDLVNEIFAKFCTGK
jgi:tRNA modification GTPase